MDNTVSTQSSLQKYLDKAVSVLDRFKLDTTPPPSEFSGLLDQIAYIDEPKVLAIAKTLRYIDTFNQLVRENVEAINVGHRYGEIADRFNSIREDSKNLVDQLEDGKINFGEKVENWWMKLTRGTPHKRFEEIKEIYKEVCVDTKDQLEREISIMNAYIDFRFALKESEVLTKEVLETQTEVVDQKKLSFEEKSAALEAFSGGDDSEKSKLQLARDESHEAYMKEDKSYQLCKDIAENLNIAYNVGETLITKLKQTHDVKDQVYRRAVTFFNTNEHVFTILDAVYTSQHGLHEATQTTEALKEGVNKGLEDISDLGRELERAALQAGYGSTVNPASVEKLVNAIVDYQVESRQLIEDLRVKATEDAKEIERIVEDGKERYRKAVLDFKSN